MANLSSALTLCLTGNEPRQTPLFTELGRLARAVVELPFDEIDPLTKGVAAALSYARPRSEWWGNYQMHPLVQARRRRVLQRALARALPTLPAPPDALIMWGSWFHPGAADAARRPLPFFTYIDQSRSRTPLPEEPPASRRRHVQSHALQAATYRDAAGILCMSEWARGQTLDAHGDTLDPHRVHVVGWGPVAVDLSLETIDPRRREPIVLHVSNDFRRKGVDFLLAVADRMAARAPEVRFVVIGRDKSGLPMPERSNVMVLGPIYDRNALADWFRRASVFFLPHRFDRSPHVLVEAMSAGLPLVVSAQGGALELTEGTGAGIAVPVGDIDGYVAALLRFVRDPIAREAAGSAGKRLMARRYNWPAIASRIYALAADARR